MFTNFKKFLGHATLAMVTFSGLATSAQASDQPLSAIRDPKASYLEYLNPQKAATSAEDMRRPYTMINWLNEVPSWNSKRSHTRLFRKMRNDRFLSNPDARFKRRISWLYPDDGCYSRSQLAIHKFRKKGVEMAKLFVFGDLKVKTPYASRLSDGHVYWWYHTVPVYKKGSSIYVVDPAINAKGPTPLQTWLSRMSDNPNSLELSICHPDTYGPNSACDGSQRTGATDSARQAQGYFLSMEWDRMLELGKNPKRILKRNPPWRNGDLAFWKY